MKVNDVMTENPSCCNPDTGLHDVAKLMVESDCGCIPVVDGEKSKMPIGMITDRDITCRVVAQGKNPLDLTARDAMTSTVLSVNPETSLQDCLNLMEESQVRRVAVVDNDGRICGIVAQADVAMNAASEKTAEVVQQVSRATA
ncbi:MAG TPA: CBS domain-containing protein [Pyrinomonadaceae bacterium]|jgi:CBS domain-containing protein